MSISTETKDSTFGEPAWDIARLFPAQGYWDEGDYFGPNTNRRVEFSDGRIEVLAMPTYSHQLILAFLYEALKAFVSPRARGVVLIGSLPVRLWPRQYREPDLLFMLAEHAHRINEQSWDGADLVMEVVGEDRHHDLVIKRADYARGGIPEYWIVDSRDGLITVLTLQGDDCAVHGEFRPGEVATSRLLPGFAVDVAEALAPAR